MPASRWMAFVVACFAGTLAAAEAVEPDADEIQLEFRGVRLGTPSAEVVRTLGLVCTASKRPEADSECTPRARAQTFATFPVTQVKVLLLDGRFDQVELVLPAGRWLEVMAALRAKWGPHTETTHIPTWLVNGARIYSYRTRDLMIVQMTSSEGAESRAKRLADKTARAAADM